MAENKVTTAQLIPILNRYALGELASPLEQLTSGWTNLTFKFSTKPNDRSYILRQYLPGTLRKISRENIQYELSFIGYLFAKLHLAVAPSLDPPGIFTLNHASPCVLFPFIDGIKFHNKPDKPVRQLWQTLAISHFLGRMHSNVTTKEYPLIPSDRSTVNLIAVKYQLVHSCDTFKEKHPDLYRRVRLLTDEHLPSIPLLDQTEEQEAFEKTLEKNLPIGYIHADLHDDNVLFALEEKKLAAVLDFDDMYIAPLLIDVAMTLCMWCALGSELDWSYVSEFLLTYQRERAMLMTDDEWNLLEIYCYLTTLNQVLFTIRADKDERETRETTNELLLPIEGLAREGKVFFERIRSIK